MKKIKKVLVKIFKKDLVKICPRTAIEVQLWPCPALVHGIVMDYPAVQANSPCWVEKFFPTQDLVKILKYASLYTASKQGFHVGHNISPSKRLGGIFKMCRLV